MASLARDLQFSFYMKKLSALLIGLIFLRAGMAHAYCEIQKLTDDALVIKQAGSYSRGRAIQFADGRKIIVVGQYHGNRQFTDDFINFLKSSATLDNNEFRLKLRALLAPMQIVADFAHKDLEYLTELVTNDSTIQFFGFESTNNITAQNFRTFKRLLPDYLSILEQRGLALTDDDTNAFLIPGGAPMYLSIYKPELAKDRPLIGTESEVEMRAQVATTKAQHQQLVQLRQELNDDPKTLRWLEEQFSQTADFYYKVDFDKWANGVLKGTPKKYLSFVRPVVLAVVDEMKATNTRDEAIVRNLIGLNQSGVQFIGLIHMESIATRLQAVCRENLGQNSSSTTSGAAAVK